MKFICEQSILSKALGIVSRAVSTRTTVPVLKTILLEASDGQLKLSASDLDFSIEKIIEVNVEEPGAVAVEAKLFMDIVRNRPGGSVAVEMSEEGSVVLRFHNFETTIVGTPASEFPNIGELEEPQESLSLDKDIFTEMIRKTSFCASIDETKGIIVGTLMEMEEDSFTMVALDGFRMGVVKEKMKNQQEKTLVVSAKILSDIEKIVQESGVEGDLNLILGEKRAVLLIEKTKMVMRLLEGEFIKYKEIIPKENSITVKVGKEDLKEAVTSASLLSQGGRNNLVTCTITNNLMEIKANSEKGVGKADVLVENSGENLEIGFNAKYLLDALKAIEDEEIKMEFNTPITPCLIKPLEGETYEYLILPVRIPGN